MSDNSYEISEADKLLIINNNLEELNNAILEKKSHNEVLLKKEYLQTLIDVYNDYLKKKYITELLSLPVEQIGEKYIYNPYIDFIFIAKSKNLGTSFISRKKRYVDFSNDIASNEQKYPEYRNVLGILMVLMHDIIMKNDTYVPDNFYYIDKHKITINWIREKYNLGNLDSINKLDSCLNMIILMLFGYNIKIRPRKSDVRYLCHACVCMKVRPKTLLKKLFLHIYYRAKENEGRTVHRHMARCIHLKGKNCRFLNRHCHTSVNCAFYDPFR